MRKGRWIKYKPKRMKKGDGSNEPSPYKVRETRVELARHCWHYLLRVARLPISPPALRMECKVTKFFHILKNCVNFLFSYFEMYF